MAVAIALFWTTLVAHQRSPQQSLPRGSARVSGRVVAAETGLVLRAAKVTLNALEDRFASTWIATTDDEGRFDFRDLPPATFTVRIVQAGFVEAAPPNIELKDKAVLDLGDLKLIRGGVIVGRVTDTYGEPVVDAAVGATRVLYRTPANKRLQLAQSTKTNDSASFVCTACSPEVTT